VGESMENLYELIIPELEKLKVDIFKALERKFEKKLRNRLYDILAVLEFKKKIYGNAAEEILSKIEIEVIN